MPKVITGTKAFKAAKEEVEANRRVGIVKAHGGNIEKVRCPFCGTMAHPRPNAKGGTTLACMSCGRQYTSRRI